MHKKIYRKPVVRCMRRGNSAQAKERSGTYTHTQQQQNHITSQHIDLVYLVLSNHGYVRRNGQMESNSTRVLKRDKERKTKRVKR